MNLLPSDSSIALSWTNPENSDLNTIEVTYYETTNSSTGKTITIEKSFTSYIIKDIINGRSYTVIVKAIDYAGNKSSGISGHKTPFGSNTALIVQKPAPITNSTVADFSIIGINIDKYKYRLDPEISPLWIEKNYGETIDLTVSANKIHTIEVIGRDMESKWQNENYPLDSRYKISSDKSSDK